MKTKNIFISLAIFTAATGAIPYSADAQLGESSTCIVMPGNAVKEKFFADYKGERIFFCCRACVKAFKKNPEKYWVKLHPEISA